MSQAISLLVGLCLLAGQTGTAWHDHAPHQVRLVTVDSSVRLEVLDWGGTGRPILFVGCYLTAHVYDDFAPKLTDQFHIYAVNTARRRSLGSPRNRIRHAAEGGGHLRGDWLARLQKPILIGNSCGGDILHALGARHPDRLGGLVYLDAAEAPTLTMSDYDLPRVDQANLPATVRKPATVSLPEAETRQMAERPLDLTSVRQSSMTIRLGPTTRGSACRFSRSIERSPWNRLSGTMRPRMTRNGQR